MKTDAPSPPAFWKSYASFALLIVGAAAGFLLYEEHEAHLWGGLPYLILLACPLMHLFMHHGHRGHGPASDDHHEHRSNQQQ